MTDRLFISHANEDAGVAERIVAYLEARGAPCWIAGRDIPARAIYADAIVEAIDACSACVVLVSKAANESDAIKREIELASHAKKPFIPIRVDGAEPSRGLAYYLRNPQWIEYKRDGERALDRIVATGGAPAQAPRSYTPPPAPPPATQARTNTIRMAALIAVVSVVSIGGGSAIWSSMNRPVDETAVSTATTADESTTDTSSTFTSDTVSESESARAARLEKERDDAVAAARRAEDGLAQERSRREAQERQGATVDVRGTWSGSWGGGYISWRLNSDGSACFAIAAGGEYSCEYNYRWRLQGDRLTIDTGSPADHWEGVVRGSEYSGTNTTTTRQFSLTR